MQTKREKMSSPLKEMAILICYRYVASRNTVKLNKIRTDVLSNPFLSKLSFVSSTQNTIQYDTVRYDTIQYHTIPYHTIPYHTIPYHTIQFNSIPYDTIRYNTIPYDTMHCNAM